MDGLLKSNWKTQLNILWFGQTIIMAMLAMSLPYWPLYISQLGSYTPQEIRFWSAAIYIAPFVAATFSSPLWGKLGDKFGYKPMVIRACLGLFVTQTLILFFSNVYLIFLFRFLQGILAGFTVAAQAWSIAISPELERGATMGKLQSATAIGNLIGPLLGGIIATYGGYHAIFSSSSLICAIVTVLFVSLLSNPEKTIKTKETSPSNHVNKTLSFLQASVLAILFVIITIQAARAMITPVFALFVTEKLGGNDITVGVLYAATGLMIFLTAPSWGKFFDKVIRNGQPIYLIIAILLFASAGLQVLHAYAATAISICVLRLLWGICLGALLPVLLTLLVDHSGVDAHGYYLGLGNGATKFGNLVGIILGALIEANFGYENSFLMTAGIYVLAGIIILFNAKPVAATIAEKTEQA